MNAAMVGRDAREDGDLRQPHRVRAGTLSVGLAVLGVRHVRAVVGAVQIDAVPTRWHEHRELELVAARRREEVVPPVADAVGAGPRVRAVGLLPRRLVTGAAADHLEAVGEGRRGARRPDVVRAEVGRVLDLVLSVDVPVDRRVPIQTLVLLDVARVPRRVPQSLVGRARRGLGRSVEAVDVRRKSVGISNWVGAHVREAQVVDLHAGGRRMRQQRQQGQQLLQGRHLCWC
mmetsp:Transcript_9028/g.26278  ORF Transcript_9028/g.26278 Transcript_9028/m.26278 type:complete len:231 (-) Transcript_9028:127-819(-)